MQLVVVQRGQTQPVNGTRRRSRGSGQWYQHQNTIQLTRSQSSIKLKSRNLKDTLRNLEKPSLCLFMACTTDFSHLVVAKIWSQETSGTGSCQGIQNPLSSLQLHIYWKDESWIWIGIRIFRHWQETLTLCQSEIENQSHFFYQHFAFSISSCMAVRAAWKDSSNGFSKSGVSPIATTAN